MIPFQSIQRLRLQLYLKMVLKLRQLCSTKTCTFWRKKGGRIQKQIMWWVLPILHSLFNFLVRGVGTRVEDASGQVLDETDSLGNADLLLFGQLASQTTLPWGGVVHRQWLGALLEKTQQKNNLRHLWRESSWRGDFGYVYVPFALQPDRYWISEADTDIDICQTDHVGSVSFKSHLEDIRHCNASVNIKGILFNHVVIDGCLNLGIVWDFGCHNILRYSVYMMSAL